MKSILLGLTLLFATTSFAAFTNSSNPPPTDKSGKYNSELRKMIDFQTLDGRKIKRFVKGTWDFAVQGGATTTALNLQDTLPKNAYVTRGYAYVVTTPTVSGGTAFSLQATCASAGDLLSTTDIHSKVAGNFFDLNATGAASAFSALSTSAACTPSIQFLGTQSGATMTAGKMNFYLEFAVHE